MPETNVADFKMRPQEVAIALPETEITAFCDRWQVLAFYLFGSVVRDDFGSDSDVDVMVTFAPEARWGFEIVEMQRELEALFGRKVDLLTKASIEGSPNWIRRQDILGTAKLIYAAG